MGTLCTHSTRNFCSLPCSTSFPILVFANNCISKTLAVVQPGYRCHSHSCTMRLKPSPPKLTSLDLNITTSIYIHAKCTENIVFQFLPEAWQPSYLWPFHGMERGKHRTAIYVLLQCLESAVRSYRAVVCIATSPAESLRELSEWTFPRQLPHHEINQTMTHDLHECPCWFYQSITPAVVIVQPEYNFGQATNIIFLYVVCQQWHASTVLTQLRHASES